MCGGGTDNYQGVGSPNYQSAAQSLLSTGKSYGQLAALAAQNAPQQPVMAPPPAPQSAFNGGIGQYLGQMGAQPMGPSPAMAAVQNIEQQYDPRTAATEMLLGYQSGFEARPLSYYTPDAMEDVDFQSTATPTPSASAPVRSGGSRTRYVSRPPGDAGYTSLGDMFDGGGPGASGDSFAGPVSSISNRFMSPRGSR